MRRTWTAFAIAWIAVIVGLGSDPGSGERTGAIILPILRALFPGAGAFELEALHGVIRKAAHVTEYAILAGFWVRALTADHRVARSRAAWHAWGIAWAVAIVDESLQSAVRSRTASVLDVGLDAAGALLVSLPIGVGGRRTMDLVTRVVLWTAAGGGAVLLAVNRMTGVASGVLWLTVPGAVVALLVRRRVRRSGADRACRGDRRRTG
jgi:VanZ family protein